MNLNLLGWRKRKSIAEEQIENTVALMAERRATVPHRIARGETFYTIKLCGLMIAMVDTLSSPKIESALHGVGYGYYAQEGKTFDIFKYSPECQKQPIGIYRDHKIIENQ